MKKYTNKIYKNKKLSLKNSAKCYKIRENPYFFLIRKTYKK